MATGSEQLVQRITEQVLASISAGAPVAVHPPAGTCTGDYSKFKDSSAKEKKDVGAGPAAAGSEMRPLSGVVTADRLAKRAAGGTVFIAPAAMITPLAQDYIKEKKLTVQRVGSSSRFAAAGAKTSGPAAPFVWWCDGHEANVEKVATQLRAQIKPFSHERSSGALAKTIKQLAGRVSSGKAAGGVLFVESAARAACFANRCKSLRAVVGTCVDAVEQGVEQLGANVLIIEHPYHGWKAMRQMVKGFAEAERKPLGDVEQQLRELSECE